MAKGIKTGGRQKGTLNKVTNFNKQLINDLLATYSESGQMNDDFLNLEPKDRILIAEKLMQYVTPKMQSTAVDLSISNQDATIENTLSTLALNAKNRKSKKANKKNASKGKEK